MNATLSDTLIGLIRTFVPLAVGWVLTQLALIGVTLPAESELQLVGALTVVATGLYWAGVTALAKRWPQTGWLLGSPKQPVYIAPEVKLTPPQPGETRDSYQRRHGI